VIPEWHFCTTISIMNPTGRDSFTRRIYDAKQSLAMHRMTIRRREFLTEE